MAMVLLIVELADLHQTRPLLDPENGQIGSV